MTEKHVLEELRNIVNNYPVEPGCTISSNNAAECVRRGWARRNPWPDTGKRSSWYVPTAEGVRVASEITDVN